VRLGAYTSCLHDKTLGEVLELLASLHLESIEVNAGGFIASPHIPVDALLASSRARVEYLAQVADSGIELSALNVNGNPLHPAAAIGSKHAEDLCSAIKLAGLLGVRNVVAMSGQPATNPGATAPAWIVEPWHSGATEVLDYQWTDVALPFWRDIEKRARSADVRVCIEMHPHNLVYNPATLMRLIERTEATHIGANMDPSHLFWQGIEPIVAIDYLGERVFHAAAKDVRMNEQNCRLHGVLDDRFRTPGPGEPALGLGGRFVLNRFPDNPSWEFVAIGRGHDVPYWTEFLAALARVNPTIAVNIEHEDVELAGVSGLTYAAEKLRAAQGAVRIG